MPKHSPTKSFELFFTPRFPLFFIFGALALAVMGNVLTDLVKLYVGGETAHLWWIFWVAAGLLVFVVVLSYSFGAIRARIAATGNYDVINQPSPAPYRGLIAFVSLAQRAHLEKAIQFHSEKLERIWLLATKDAAVLANELQAEFATVKCNVTIIPLDDPWNLPAVKTIVEKIYREQLGGLAEEEVIADFTGGTKPMTVGMIFACLSPSRHLEYVPALYDADKPKPLDPVEYFLSSATTANLAVLPNNEKETKRKKR